MSATDKYVKCEWNLHNPIEHECPRCKQLTMWGWCSEEYNFPKLGIYHPKGALHCKRCGWIVDDPVIDFKIKPMHAWKEDPANYIVKNKEVGK
jgi:hypothetical protein